MQSLLHIFWDPSPIALDLGFITIAWYGLAWAISFLIGYTMVGRFFKRDGVPEKWLDSLILYIVLGSVIGARLGHCLFYEPDYYLANPIEILYIRQGGMASHGGAIGIILVLFWFSRKVSKRPILWVLDRVVIPVALAGMLIRGGNLINQEIVGAPTDASYGFVFPANDQSGDFKGKPDSKGVEVSHRAGNQRAATLGLMRQVDDHNWVDLGGNWKSRSKDKESWIYQVDPVPKDTCCYTYVLVGNQEMGVTEVPGIDSNDTRKVRLVQNVGVNNITFAGKWVGDSVRLKFDWGAATSRPNLTLGLFSSIDGQKWTIERSIVLDGSSQAVLEGTYKPASTQSTTYRIMLKEAADLHYIARHPTQIYEAVAYLLIFIFLILLYQRQNGVINLGQTFGLFLVLVFFARFLIEFVKENQEPWEADLPLNMGQLLSIPFVLAGLYFWWTSRKRGPFEGENPK